MSVLPALLLRETEDLVSAKFVVCTHEDRKCPKPAIAVKDRLC